jgi:hypothetical protein
MLKEEVAGSGGGELLTDEASLPTAFIWKYLRAVDEMCASSAGIGRRSLEGLVLAQGR